MKRYKDKEKRRAYLKVWKLKNADRLKLKNNRKAKEWRLANPDKAREKGVQAWERHKEKKRDAVRRWRAAHVEELKVRGKAYHAANKDRSRNAALLRIYGITEFDYQAMLFHQGGVCAICKRDNKGKRFHVDHCHVLKEVRGLLCTNCNTLLAHARDSIAILREAIKYLERNYHDAAKIVQDFSGRICAGPVEREEQIRLATISEQSARFTGQSSGDRPRGPHDS